MRVSRYTAEAIWERGEREVFIDNRYSRRHRLRFDGGAQLAGSSSPQIAPLPWSDAAAVDPEEAFVAALLSCHRLWFLLSIAARDGLCVDRYRDLAEGTMGRNEQGRLAMTRVWLRPEVRFSGPRLPDPEQVAAASRGARQMFHRQLRED